MRVDRRNLHSALNELSKVASPKAVLPILRNVLLHQRGDALDLTATDLTTRLSYYLPADGPDFETCLPAKTLALLVKPEGRADTGTVDIRPQQDSKRVTVEVDGLTTHLPSQAPADFPATMADSPDLEWSSLALWNAKALRASLDYVLPSASNDPSRQHLCTVLLDAQHMVSTDGHRLHLVPLPSPIDTAILLPATAARTLYRLLNCDGDVRLSLTKDTLRAQIGRWQLDVKLTEKEFPPYHQVIPDHEAQPTRIHLEAGVFTKALARIARVSESKRIRMHINGVVTLQSWDLDLGEAEIEVPTIQNNHQGDDLITAFDLTYLQDAMRTGASSVQMGFGRQLDPLRVDLEGGRLAVIMPLRL